MATCERSTASCPRPAAGFTYLGVMLLLAVLALTTVAAVRLGEVVQRRAGEQALLRVGLAFTEALRSYARATPPGLDPAPATLAALLLDPRFPGTVRHLRRLYADPLTGRTDWGLVRDEVGGGIVGIFSLAPGRPIKVAAFDTRLTGFDGSQRYADWVFTRPDEERPDGPRKGLIRPSDMDMRLREPEAGAP